MNRRIILSIIDTLNISYKFKKMLLAVFKSLLLVYIFGISLILDYRQICYGLDSSHFFATNYFFNKYIKFGPDVVWTYGPLGFLIKPVNIGHNLDIAIFFQIMVWVIFCSTFIYLTFKRYISVLQLCFFAFFFTFARGADLLFDYFICTSIFLLLSASFFIKKWKYLYIFALFFSVFLWMVKFDLAFATLSALIVFIAVRYGIDKKEAIRINILTLILFPLIFIALYMIYNPSFVDMILYIKGIYYISSGYSLNSLSGKRVELFVLLFFLVLYLLLVFLLRKVRQKSFFIAVILAAPIFVAFKRGFTRQDTHVFTFFSFSLVSLAIIFLFTDIKKIMQGAVKQRAWTSLIISMAVAYVFLCQAICHLGINPIYFVRSSISVFNYAHAKGTLERNSAYCLKDAKLAKELLNMIGKSSVGIFPYEVSYVAANELNYKPFPVFQTYSAYTSYLDLLNAQFIENQNRAPEFILFEWKTIDGRHPLIDVPAMWLSIYKWYDIVQQNYDILLLKRRKEARFAYLEYIGTKEYNINGSILIPASTSPIIINIHTKLNAQGLLYKIFFRIPEVRVELFTGPESSSSFRVIPDTLNDGLWVNHLPLDIRQTNALISNNEAEGRINRLKIYGEGIKFYNDKIKVDFYKIPETKINIRKG